QQSVSRGKKQSLQNTDLQGKKKKCLIRRRCKSALSRGGQAPRSRAAPETPLRGQAAAAARPSGTCRPVVCAKCCIGKISEGNHLEKRYFFPPSGPGVLTRTLLNAGVRVVALESHSAFLPNLQSLENRLDGQLKVIYGDFFRLDPLITGPVKPPAVCSEKLFESMGVAAVPWRADVPVKIFGILPQKKERNTLWRLLFALYECSSIYRYGRVELNVFISEKEYKVLTAKPAEVRAYQALSVLWQVGCEIQLLHMVSISYQLTWLIKKCSIMTLFVLCFSSWSLYNGRKLLRELEIPENAETVNLYPEDYRRLFEALQSSSVFTESWFHDEVLESIRNINF
uniref:rRNA adenine N(6)-methyltransferase n=1 Tax=Apteryx owenii TaxID=8824 RepID=A0A8B9QVY8_APTOW